MKQPLFFTVVQYFIFAVIGIMFVAVVYNVVNANQNGSNITYGVNGLTESRCIEGYKFVLGQDGRPRQILDEFGKGVKCQIGVI